MDTAAAASCKRHAAGAASRRRRSICLIVCTAILLLAAVVLVVLALTGAIRPRAATTSVSSVRLAGLRAGLAAAALAVDLNVSLAVDLSVRNPNPASFRYSSGHAEIYYRGALAGEAAIPPGAVGAGGQEDTTVYLTVLAGRLVGSAAALYADVMSGAVPLTTETTIPGTVSVLGFLRHRMVTYTTCDVVVDVRRRDVVTSDCNYRTKF